MGTGKATSQALAWRALGSSSRWTFISQTTVGWFHLSFNFFRTRRSCCWGASSPCWSLACTSSSSSGRPSSTQGPLLLAWSSPVSWYVPTCIPISPYLENLTTMSSPLQVCIMVGSALFSILSQRGLSEATILKVGIKLYPNCHQQHSNNLQNCLLMIATTMAICCVTTRPGASNIDTVVSFLAFLLLEIAIGMYFPAISYLR